MRIDKPRKYQLSGRIDHPASLRRIDPLIDSFDLFPLDQKIGLPASPGRDNGSILYQDHKQSPLPYRYSSLPDERACPEITDPLLQSVYHPLFLFATCTEISSFKACCWGKWRNRSCSLWDPVVKSEYSFAEYLWKVNEIGNYSAPPGIAHDPVR